MSEINETSWIYCNACRHPTRHVLVGKKEYDYRSLTDDAPLGEWGEYRLWACAGCDTCTMEDYYTADYFSTDSNGNEYYESVYYPKRQRSDRSVKHFVNLSPKLGILYSEVVKSNNEELHLLCAAGLRALLEGVCADKGIQGANLEKKIEGMKRLLPESIVTNLHAFRFMGNRAVHELEAPKGYELTVALDVIEDILNFLYALDYNASLLAKLRALQDVAQVTPKISASAPTAEPSSAMLAQPPSDKVDG